MATESNPKPVRKTLGLTGITINAMALTAPGAFLWLLYQVQAAASFDGVADIWPGVLLALLSALITALSFGELARRYPEAGFRSAYHFADRFFARQKNPRYKFIARLGKFATGWTAHLYYWIYPGVLVAFMGILADYLLRYFGYQPTVFGEVILAVSFSAFVGFLALRGITGTTTTSVILNTIQLITLFVFAVLAIAFRLINPASFSTSEWVYPSVTSVLLPHSFNGVIFQTVLAMILMVGFESSTALGASASNAQRDVPRGAILALVIQGLFAYLVGYFVAGFALNIQINATVSPAPLGDLALQFGELLLGGYGTTLMVFFGFTVAIALLGGTLTAINNGVRISFAMALDDEMPDVLGFLHPKYATPYNTVILLSTVCAIIGSAGIIGGLPVLMGIILASNLGAFLLYALLCLLTIVTFVGDSSFNVFRHLLLPLIGLAVNIGLVVTAGKIGLAAGGIITQASMIALGIAAAWFVVSVAFYFVKRKK
ncbi:MAG TPA: APC family permease [Anaerolineales bacterium]|nr:APC family permease [Anaerolineales bacterium]